MSNDDRTWGFTRLRERQPLICQGIVWISYSVCGGVKILEMIPVLCLSMAGVYTEAEQFKIAIDIDTEFIGIELTKHKGRLTCQLHHFRHCSLHFIAAVV